jgi:hypothetical protein
MSLFPVIPRSLLRGGSLNEDKNAENISKVSLHLLKKRVKEKNNLEANYRE